MAILHPALPGNSYDKYSCVHSAKGDPSAIPSRSEAKAFSLLEAKASESDRSAEILLQRSSPPSFEDPAILGMAEQGGDGSAQDDIDKILRQCREQDPARPLFPFPITWNSDLYLPDPLFPLFNNPNTTPSLFSDSFPWAEAPSSSQQQQQQVHNPSLPSSSSYGDSEKHSQVKELERTLGLDDDSYGDSEKPSSSSQVKELERTLGLDDDDEPPAAEAAMMMMMQAGTPNSSMSSSSCEGGDDEQHDKGPSASKRKTPEPEFEESTDDKPSSTAAAAPAPDGRKSQPPAKVARKKGPKNSRVREPRFAIQTRSDVEIMDDSYRWRKYGQKAVKNSPYPRSYYRCTNSKCPVRKRVERSSEDPGLVITTYEGTHNHLSPATRHSSESTSSYPFVQAPPPPPSPYPRSSFDLSVQMRGAGQPRFGPSAATASLIRSNQPNSNSDLIARLQQSQLHLVNPTPRVIPADSSQLLQSLQQQLDQQQLQSQQQEQQQLQIQRFPGPVGSDQATDEGLLEDLFRSGMIRKP